MIGETFENREDEDKALEHREVNNRGYLCLHVGHTTARGWIQNGDPVRRSRVNQAYGIVDYHSTSPRASPFFEN